MTAGSSFTNAFGAGPIVPANPSYEALTIAVATTLVWPQETTGGSPYVAAQIDVTASVAALTLKMPPGNTGSTGAQTVMTNVGAQSFTLIDNSGASIAILAPTQSWLITLIDNSTTVGSWRAYQLAATTSNATAASLAGLGLQANGTLLQAAWTTVYKSVDTAITTAYRSTEVVWNGVTGTLQLNAAATLTAGWFCAFTNNGTGAVTISTSGGATINGTPTLVMQPGNSGVIVCDGTNFNTIGALINTLTVVGGGTGATNANSALTNLGGTSVGKSIFTAPTAAAVIALLGLNNSNFIEGTVAVDQILNSGSSNSAFVATAPITITLPLTTSLTTQFVFMAYAFGGAITVTPKATDKINGGSIGVSLTLPTGSSAFFVTDANGNWWTLFGPALSGSTLTLTGALSVSGASTLASPTTIGGYQVFPNQFGDVKTSGLGIEGYGWRLCYGQTRPRTDPLWVYLVANGLTGSWVFGNGDGATTYTMPDFRGRTIFGKDNMGGAAAGRVTNGVSGVDGTTIGATGGSQSLQTHTHAVNDAGHAHALPSVLNESAGTSNYGAGAQLLTDTTINSSSATTGITITNTGAGGSQNMPPAMVLPMLMYVGI